MRDRLIASGYCDATTDSLDDAIAQWQAARDARRPLALALCANSAVVLPELAKRGILPDIVTDQTFPDPLKGYVPVESEKIPGSLTGWEIAKISRRRVGG